MKNNPFSKHPSNKCFNELSPDSIEQVEHACEEAAQEDEYTSFIMDDCAIALKDKYVQRVIQSASL